MDNALTNIRAQHGFSSLFLVIFVLMHVCFWQHVICAAPKLIEKHLKAAGGPGLVVESQKIVWTPYNAERDYANFGR